MRVTKCLNFAVSFQSQVIELASAVINGYLDQVKQLSVYSSSDESCFHSCLIDACLQVNAYFNKEKLVYSSVFLVLFWCYSTSE